MSELWVLPDFQCGEDSPDRKHVCTIARSHPGAHVAMDPVFGVPFAAWPGETRVHVASVTREELDRVGWLSKAEGIARASRVSLDDLLGRVRTASVSRARHTLWLAMSRAGMSSLEIARIFGRNHATVLYGKGRIAHEQASKPRLEVSRDPGT